MNTQRSTLWKEYCSVSQTPPCLKAITVATGGLKSLSFMLFDYLTRPVVMVTECHPAETMHQTFISCPSITSNRRTADSPHERKHKRSRQLSRMKKRHLHKNKQKITKKILRDVLQTMHTNATSNKKSNILGMTGEAADRDQKPNTVLLSCVCDFTLFWCTGTIMQNRCRYANPF